MKISYNWLQKFLKTSITPNHLSEILTSTGLEVESLETWSEIPGALEGLLVGEVMDVKKHPDADRLNITRINLGNDQLLQIVCGASNVAAGQKVVIAPVGATVHPLTGSPFLIKKSKIRGEWSEGMICAEDEIGLGPDHAGILVLPAEAVAGQSLVALFSSKTDLVFEIGITPNRSDALSHKGVARDILAFIAAHKDDSNDPSAHVEAPMNLKAATWFDGDFDKPGDLTLIHSFSGDHDRVKVVIENADDCIRFSGLCISGVQVKESPVWLQNNLRAIGLRPVNNIVDITNYICHDMGQPMHAYDLRQIKGGVIKAANIAGSTPFITLDGITRCIHESDLMIADAEGPLGIAGVFGGLNSGIRSDTTEIFLESACFNAVSVRKTARRHGLKTDASFRYERGTDVDQTLAALELACQLVLELAGGQVTSSLQDVYPRPVVKAQVHLARSRLDSLLGLHIPTVQVDTILKGLGIGILRHVSGNLPGHTDILSDENWDLSIPAFKTDVTREADIIEEILRIYGFNAIPTPVQLRSSLPFTLAADPERIRESTADWLCATGFNEIMTNSLSASVYLELDGPELVAQVVHVLNPLSSDLDVLRQSLLFSGLKAVSYNLNRRINNLKFFEFGKSYHKFSGRYEEQNHLAIFMTGAQLSDSWLGKNEPLNFYHMKGIVDSLLTRLNVQASTTVRNDITWLDEALGWNVKKRNIATAGRVNSLLLKEFGIETDVWYMTIQWDELLKIRHTQPLLATPVPRFPAVRRDLSLLVDRDVEFDTLRTLALQCGISILKHISVFDVYAGDKIQKDKKSYALSFMLESTDHTLTDEEIESAMKKIGKQLTDKSGAQVRK